MRAHILANGEEERLLGSSSSKLLSLTLPQPFPQGSKESLRVETQNISNSFEDLDAQVNSDTGYTPEDATGLEEEAAQQVRTNQAKASRYHLSTQKMYELKTKLRCSSEGCPQVGQGGGRPWSRAPEQGVGTSDSPCPFPQMW